MNKKAAVVIDAWKLSIFKQILDNAGYVYEQKPLAVENTIILMVEYDFAGALKPYIEKAQAECRKIEPIKNNPHH